VPLQCSDHAVLKATSQGHGTARQGRGKGMGMGMACVNVGRERRSASSGYYAFTNQKAAALWNVFVPMTMETAIIRNMN